MDEQKVKNTLTAASTQGVSGQTESTAAAAGEDTTGFDNAARIRSMYSRVRSGESFTPQYNEERAAEIGRMYDAARNQQVTGLEESGAQALSDAQANRDSLAGIYNTQRNAAAVDWERQRRNFLEGAATSGINTGAGSQAELSMMGMRQRSQNQLGQAQAQAEAEADRKMADIKRSTQAAIAEAVSKNDYNRAAALLDEYNNAYNRSVTEEKMLYDRDMQRAQLLGQYGDFSGYADLYGDETAAQAKAIWAAQNPQLAFSAGAITADQYDNLRMGRPMNEGLDETGTRIAGTSLFGFSNTGNSGWTGIDYDNQGQSRSDIMEAQRVLHNMGLYNGNIDGLRGNQTDAALAAAKERGVNLIA